MEAFVKSENKYMNDVFLETSTANVLIYDYNTGIEIAMGEVESDELSQKVDEEKIKAGTDNHTVAVINKNKEITFKVVEVVTRFELMTIKMGAKIKKGNVSAVQFPKYYTVEKKSGGTDLAVTLAQTPIYDNEIIIYDENGDMIPKEKYTVSANTITFASSSCPVEERDSVKVGSFQYTIEADYADIGSDALPSVVSVIVEKPIFDTSDRIIKWKQYFFPKCKMDNNFTYKGQTEKTKNTEETSFTVMKDPKYDYLGRLLFLDAENYKSA